MRDAKGAIVKWLRDKAAGRLEISASKFNVGGAAIFEARVINHIRTRGGQMARAPFIRRMARELYIS